MLKYPKWLNETRWICSEPQFINAAEMQDTKRDSNERAIDCKGKHFIRLKCRQWITKKVVLVACCCCQWATAVYSLSSAQINNYRSHLRYLMGWGFRKRVWIFIRPEISRSSHLHKQCAESWRENCCVVELCSTCSCPSNIQLFFTFMLTFM